MWSKKLTEEIKKNDKKFETYLKNKKISPYSQNASKEWQKSGFKKKQNQIFNKYKK